MIESDGQRMVYEGFQVPKVEQVDDSKNQELQVAPNFENFSQTNKVDHSKGKIEIEIIEILTFYFNIIKISCFIPSFSLQKLCEILLAWLMLIKIQQMRF
jgi:hypothetical protein